MKADFKFFRQGGGRGAFAHVFLEGAPAASEHVTAADGDPELVLAALAGCHAALRWRPPAEPWQITVVHIAVNLVDTTPEAVAVSACLATLRLVHGELGFEPRWMNDHWGIWDPSRSDVLPITQGAP